MAARFNVRSFRDAHGLPQQHVADHLGVAVRSVQRWEAGDASPSPMALKALQDLKAKHEGARTPAAAAHDDEPVAPASTKPRRPALLPSIDA